MSRPQPTLLTFPCSLPSPLPSTFTDTLSLFSFLWFLERRQGKIVVCLVSLIIKMPFPPLINLLSAPESSPEREYSHPLPSHMESSISPHRLFPHDHPSLLFSSPPAGSCPLLILPPLFHPLFPGGYTADGWMGVRPDRWPTFSLPPPSIDPSVPAINNIIFHRQKYNRTK